MERECNRDIVENYICHKLSKRGFVWSFEEVQDENAANNGSVVAPAPTLVRRCHEAGTGPERERDRGSISHLCKQPPASEQRAAVHRVLREAGDELERLYQPDFTEMSRQLYLSSTTAQRRFAEVIDELFRDGVNWGRIIAFFEFGGAVCAECAAKEEMSPQVDNIAEWMTEYLNGSLNSWIQDNGGWVGVIQCRRRCVLRGRAGPPLRSFYCAIFLTRTSNPNRRIRLKECLNSDEPPSNPISACAHYARRSGRSRWQRRASL